MIRAPGSTDGLDPIPFNCVTPKVFTHCSLLVTSIVSRTRMIALLPYCRTALLPYCLTALLPYCPIALLPYETHRVEDYGFSKIIMY